MALRLVGLGGPFHAQPDPHLNGAGPWFSGTVRTTGLPHPDAEYALVVPSAGEEVFGDYMSVTPQSWLGHYFWYMWETDGDAIEDGDVISITGLAARPFNAEYQSSSGKFRIVSTLVSTEATGYDFSLDTWYKMLIVVGPTASPNREYRVYVNTSQVLSFAGSSIGGPLMQAATSIATGEAANDGNKVYALWTILDSTVEADHIPDWYAEYDQHSPDSNSATYADGKNAGNAGTTDFSYVDDWVSGGTFSYGANQEWDMSNLANQEQAFGLTAATKTFRNSMVGLVLIATLKLNAGSKNVALGYFIYDGSNYDEIGLLTQACSTTNDISRGDIFNKQADGSTAWTQAAVASHEIGIARDTDTAIVECAAFGAWAVAFGNTAIPEPPGEGASPPNAYSGIYNPYAIQYRDYPSCYNWPPMRPIRGGLPRVRQLR